MYGKTSLQCFHHEICFLFVQEGYNPVVWNVSMKTPYVYGNITRWICGLNSWNSEDFNFERAINESLSEEIFLALGRFHS